MHKKVNKNQDIELYRNRLEVAELIMLTVLDKISVSEALSKFPKDINDINIKCAFDALMHREADEDLRRTVADYKEVQDELLVNIADALKKNQNLPQNIVSEYLKYHNQNLISPEGFSIKNTFDKIKRMINL